MAEEPYSPPSPSSSSSWSWSSYSSSLSSDEENEGMAKRIWRKCRYEIIQAMYTPFMLCLAAGASLNEEKYIIQIEQEIYILNQYSLTAEAAMRTDDEMAKVKVWQQWWNGNEMRKLHETFLENYDEPEEEVGLEDCTVNYIHFLKATASGVIEGLDEAPEDNKLAAYIVAALTPRMRLFAYLGKTLKTVIGPDVRNHPHRRWIKYFSSKDFQKEALQTEELLEMLCELYLTTQLEVDIAVRLYHQALTFEVEVLLMQSFVEETYVPLSVGSDSATHQLDICTDFDWTCTDLDSDVILADLTCVKASKKDDKGKSANELKATWDGLFHQYNDEYLKCMDKICGDIVVDMNVAADHLSAFEKQANARVVASKALKGLSIEEIKQCGEEVNFPGGCLHFLHSAIDNPYFTTNIHIISYSWSHYLIKSAFSSAGLDCVKIHANELVYKKSISTGGITTSIKSPKDKCREFYKVQKAKTKRKKVTVYIGGNSGDLSCLLTADVGIVLDPSPGLSTLIEHFDIEIEPLYSYLVGYMRFFKNGGQKEKALYKVSCWDEIHAFILGF